MTKVLPTASLRRWAEPRFPRVERFEVCTRRHWGCAIYSLVDVSTEDGEIWGFDPNGADGDDAVYCQQLSLAEWLDRWVDGSLHQPAVIEDPETGEWRGATDAEIEEWIAGPDD